MKCKVDIENGVNDTGIIVKRRFIPIPMTIEREGQFMNASTKLPFTANKVIGILTTSKVDKPCIDTPPAKKLYYGVSDELITDASFVNLTPGVLYSQLYPPDVSIPHFLEGYWYYAHPVSDGLPFVFGNDFEDYLYDPLTVPVLTEGHCNPEMYSLWSGSYMGGMDITYYPET